MANPIFYTNKLCLSSTFQESSTQSAASSGDNLLDQNLNTFWESSVGTTGRYFTIDTETATNDVDAMALWNCNYTARDYSDITIFINASINNSDWSANLYEDTPFSNGVPLAVFDLSTAVSDQRYVRVTFSAQTTTMHIGQVFLFRKRQISAPSELPSEPRLKYINKSNMLEAGHGLVRNVAQNPISIFDKNFTIEGSSNFITARAIFQECMGMYGIFVYKDNSNEWVCRLTHDEEQFGHSSKDLYQPYSFRFASLPYISDGESY